MFPLILVSICNAAFVIVSQANPDLVLDVERGSSSKEARLIVDTYRRESSQMFTISPDGVIMSLRSGLVVDVEGGLKEGANIIQHPFHGGPNQKWSIQDDGTIRVKDSSLVLDIYNNRNWPGANVVAWNFNGGINQKWKLMPVSISVIASEANPDLVLDVEGGSSLKETRLIMNRFSGESSQMFVTSPDGGITSFRSDLVVDVEGGLKEGANIIQYPFHGGPNQKWNIQDDGTIRVKDSSLVLDIYDKRIQPGTKVIAWNFNGGINQKWKVKPFSEMPFPVKGSTQGYESAKSVSTCLTGNVPCEPWDVVAIVVLGLLFL